MSYERQRTVSDGESIITRDDPAARDATKGVLDHGLGPDNKARVTRTDFEGTRFVQDEKTVELLQYILIELRKINMYNAIAHDQIIADNDVLIGDEQI